MLLAERLLEWYQQNARVLPWRSDPTPYKVWISEIMLQQTQVETVIPYFAKWVQHFPDISTLASADEQDILKLWEGLGYYSRARNIYKTACILHSSYEDKLPEDVNQLVKLPGIGEYTAGAIASMAFGKNEIALDANIRRVYARLLNMEYPLGTQEAENALQTFGYEQLPDMRAGDFNQALMDLGSAICLSQNPRCLLCPLMDICQARIQGTQNSVPVKKDKSVIPHHIVTAAVVQKDGMVFIAQRPSNGLLGGLWEFPGGKMIKSDPDLESCLKREIREELAVEIEVGDQIGIYKHAYTHFKITLHAFSCMFLDGQKPQNLHHQKVAWVEPGQLEAYPMGKVDRKIANTLKDPDA